jgi:hypothetical protein
LGPIPFSKRGASEPSKIDSKKPGQMPSMWVRAMDKKKRPNFAGLKV